MPQVGPITIWVISTTLTPASGNPVPVIIVSVFSEPPAVRTLGFRLPSEKYNLTNSIFAILERRPNVRGKPLGT